MSSPLPATGADHRDPPLELTEALAPGSDQWSADAAHALQPEMAAERGADGRRVLGVTLGILALAWIGLAGWSAGQSIGRAASAAAVAQWLAVAAAPLVLLGLVWLIFGRTRRREAERFTHAVQVMRAEASSLEQLLGVLRTRLDEEQAALGAHAERLMRLGDEASHRLGGVTRELGAGSETLSRHAAALDRAAESARNDIAVLLEDLPRAEASSRAMAEELRGSGREASAQAAALEAQLAAISGRAREAEDSVGGAAQRLVAHLTQIESAGAAAATRVGDAGTSASAEVDALLARTGEALVQVRAGIDEQSAAVRALVEQSAAAIGIAGHEAATSLGTRLGSAGQALDGLSTRIAEQDRAVTALVSGLERQLADVDQRFVDLAAEGDLRAQAVASAIDRVRRELDGLSGQQAASGGTLEDLAGKTEQLRSSVAALQRECGEELTGALSHAEGGAERLLAAVQAARPDVEWIASAALDASQKLDAGTAGLAGQQERLTTLLATIDNGVGSAEQRLTELSQAIASAEQDATRLQAETGPALVQAMVQIREAAAQAATRAREALAAVVPETADQLSAQARTALTRAVEDSVRAQLAEVERVATQALSAAQSASEGLSRQMLNIGRTASALEQHMVKTTEEARETESEAFARRSSVLIDSLHSASIDVGRILSDEVDDRAWAAYLKGDRGVFTRKAVRLLSSSDLRTLDQQVGTDPEFAASVTRYVQDFEAMLRRVGGEREGGMMAVTLLSSDMGRLYTALAQVLERRR
ncbi:hypothetical protein [Sphingomonas astaxanthinifaciens]|uniref:hypothetical protein n=1 Tax=Sphingomonas astaxanthinifaciens TaxID=407019 RepID=UPI0004A71355|nr:hypothetical protein [Sphingomonas astaxanthinifaciens]